jgi:hypothetical protein
MCACVCVCVVVVGLEKEGEDENILIASVVWWLSLLPLILPLALAGLPEPLQRHDDNDRGVAEERAAR